jgi:glycosyltransferase involved in cell wall biosynthesis
MNVFFIPSWYPSASDPLPGVFFREQALALVKHTEDINIGISTWGQNDDRLLLWAKEPLGNLLKIHKRRRMAADAFELIEGRLTEYFSPTLTWSSKVFQGNINNIVKANRYNLTVFEERYGKADIIHAHVGYPAGHITRLLSKKEKIPYVITEQMSPFPHKYFNDSKGNLIRDLKLAYNHSLKNIAISQALAQSMAHQHIRNITVIPNLVDEDFFKPSAVKRKNEKFTFFTLGRMVPQKGIDILLKAFSLLNPEAVLRIGGDGPHLSTYKQIAVDLKISQNIHWLGRLDKSGVLDELQQCDAFVLPSRHESMGVVFAEAMACGKPVIATVCGGPEEFIDKSIGFLVTPENTVELANAMEKMINERQQFDSEVIRKKFVERFSARVVSQQISNIYRQLLP